jgi:DNA-binding XRE family transcriptional regulator
MVNIILMTKETLKQWRNENGYTQVTLAKVLNVSHITIARWETGVRKIPSFLHLTLDALECKAKEVKEEKGKRKRKGGVKHGKYLQATQSKNRMGK